MASPRRGCVAGNKYAAAAGRRRGGAVRGVAGGSGRARHRREETITTTDGEYGQALISRWSIRDLEIHDISYQEREPRRAMRCRCCAVGLFRVIATHLGLSIGERRGQARALLGLIGEARSYGGDGRLQRLVLGRLSAESAGREAAGAQPARGRSESFCPLFRFDRIYCSPVSALLKISNRSEARQLSDHLPVMGNPARRHSRICSGSGSRWRVEGAGQLRRLWRSLHRCDRPPR